MGFKACILMSFVFLFINFGCLGFETPGELQSPELTNDEKVAIAKINDLPAKVADIEKAKLSTIFDEKNFIDYFKEVGGPNFELFIKSIGASEEAIKRYIELFIDRNEFAKFVTNQNGFKDFVLLSKTPRFNEKFQIFAKKTFDQALKDNPILSP